MKKRVSAWILCATLLFAAGCGSTDSGDESTSGTESAGFVGAGLTDADATGRQEDWQPLSAAYDMNGSDYVTLCDYSEIPVTITGDYTVEDADVEEYFAQIFTYYAPFYVTDTDKTVIGDGDIVNVDYVGKLDGVAFEGGSAQNQMIDVDNNSSVGYYASRYIDGFTDGLRGASVGDVIDCDVTFPEEYGNTDLAGKAVVFTFTVNAILKEVSSIEEIDDTFAKEQFNVDTVEEMYGIVRDALVASAEQTRLGDVIQEVQNYLLENCEVEIPEEYLNARISDYRHQFIENYCAGDESQLEAYLSDYYGRTVEEMEEIWHDGVERTISIEFVVDAIAQELGIEVDEAEYAEYVAQAVEEEYCNTAEELYTLYGYGDAAYGEKYFRDIYRYGKALEALADTAVVEEVLVEPDTTEETADGVDGTVTE